MRRPLRLVLAICAVQALLMGAYWIVEILRSESDNTPSVLSTAPPQRLRGSMPELSVRGRDGLPRALGAMQRPTLVHFWATWCPPCRVELPGLLELADGGPLDVVTIALDRDWAEVERFLGRPPVRMLLGDAAEVEARLGVRALPATFLVDAKGDLRLRFDGARDWRNTRFVGDWIGSAE